MELANITTQNFYLEKLRKIDSRNNRKSNMTSDYNHMNQISNTTDDFQKTNKPQRYRTKFSYYQIEKMKRVFQQNNYPSTDEINNLALKFNLPEGTIRLWFKNYRSKHKKIHTEESPETNNDSKLYPRKPKNENSKKRIKETVIFS